MTDYSSLAVVIQRSSFKEEWLSMGIRPAVSNADALSASWILSVGPVRSCLHASVSSCNTVVILISTLLLGSSPAGRFSTLCYR